jgi:hypothetical protein
MASQEYHCVFCGRLVDPTPELKAQLAEGAIIGLAHVGEFVEMSARQPSVSSRGRGPFVSRYTARGDVREEAF